MSGVTWHAFNIYKMSICVFECVVLAVCAFVLQDGHFENTYYSDFISNLAKVKYAGEA